VPEVFNEPERVIAVALGAVFAGDDILLIRRERQPFAGLWGLPGGKLQPGEHLGDGVCREVREEAGIRAHFQEFCGAVTEQVRRSGRHWAHYLLLVCRLRSAHRTLRPSSEGPVKWFPVRGLSGFGRDMIPSDRLMLSRLVLSGSGPRYYRCEIRGTKAGFRVSRFE
jgi:ADP-ribose pyrophosphatase YjhB (NUDIX family)